MKTYQYKTDAVSGTIEASSARDALAAVLADEHITDQTIADGAWAWVEAEDGTEDRLLAGRMTAEAEQSLDEWQSKG